jgi:hypothetical protein
MNAEFPGCEEAFGGSDCKGFRAGRSELGVSVGSGFVGREPGGRPVCVGTFGGSELGGLPVSIGAVGGSKPGGTRASIGASGGIELGSSVCVGTFGGSGPRGLPFSIGVLGGKEPGGSEPGSSTRGGEFTGFRAIIPVATFGFWACWVAPTPGLLGSVGPDGGTAVVGPPFCSTFRSLEFCDAAPGGTLVFCGPLDGESSNRRGTRNPSSVSGPVRFFSGIPPAVAPAFCGPLTGMVPSRKGAGNS